MSRAIKKRKIQKIQDLGGFIENPEVLNHLGIFYYMVGEKEKAISYFERALMRDFELAYNNIGVTYFTLEEYDRAIKFFDSACSKLDNFIAW